MACTIEEICRNSLLDKIKDVRGGLQEDITEIKETLKYICSTQMTLLEFRAQVKRDVFWLCLIISSSTEFHRLYNNWTYFVAQIGGTMIIAAAIIAAALIYHAHASK